MLTFIYGFAVAICCMLSFVALCMLSAFWYESKALRRITANRSLVAELDREDGSMAIEAILYIWPPRKLKPPAFGPQK